MARTPRRTRAWGLGVVAHQVKALNRLIEDLLDVSRLSKGKIHLRTEVVDLASVVARAVESVTALVKERGHELTVSVPRDRWWSKATRRGWSRSSGTC